MPILGTASALHYVDGEPDHGCFVVLVINNALGLMHGRDVSIERDLVLAIVPDLWPPAGIYPRRRHSVPAVKPPCRRRGEVGDHVHPFRLKFRIPGGVFLLVTDIPAKGPPSNFPAGGHAPEDPPGENAQPRFHLRGVNISAGGQTTYTLTVGNNGTEPIVDPNIVDKLLSDATGPMMSVDPDFASSMPGTTIPTDGELVTADVLDGTDATFTAPGPRPGPRQAAGNGRLPPATDKIPSPLMDDGHPHNTAET